LISSRNTRYLFWYKKSADKGDSDEINYADYYKYGIGIEKDENKVSTYYKNQKIEEYFKLVFVIIMKLKSKWINTKH
jgi:TPR repeat protein